MVQALMPPTPGGPTKTMAAGMAAMEVTGGLKAFPPPALQRPPSCHCFGSSDQPAKASTFSGRVGQPAIAKRRAPSMMATMAAAS